MLGFENSDRFDLIFDFLLSLIIFLVLLVIRVEWPIAGVVGPGLEVLETVAQRRRLPRAEKPN